MTIVDLVKARAYADGIEDETAQDWIRTLADEVESLERALVTTRASEQAALADATAAVEEAVTLRGALAELLASVSRMLADIGRLA